MLRNYIKTALRNIRKNRLYSFINITGLTVGLAACLLIGVYIAHELSYDNFHKKGDRIVRATMEFSPDGTVNYVAETGTKVGPQFKRTFPAVEEYVRVMQRTNVVKYGDKVFEENNYFFADPAFFTVFTFPLLEGNPATALDAPDKIVITQSIAKKYFGTDHAIDKVLSIRDKDYHISGIAEDAPQNSQIKFDFVTQFSNLGNYAKEEIWFTANHITYLLLRDAQQIPSLQKQISAYMRSKEIKEELHLQGSNYLTFNLEPIKTVHLHSNLAGFEPNGSVKYIYLFTIIALLILIIACANYTNLATAQSVGRSGEIGIRKVLGASKKQVFFQFIGESFVLSIVASILAFLLAILLIPYFNILTGKSFTPEVLLKPLVIAGTIVLAFVVSFFAGAYPALVLSGTEIISVLKKGFRFAGSSVALRKVLIVVQFGISVFLIIYTIIIFQQMNYMHNKNLGYAKDHLLILPVDNKMTPNYENIKRSIAQVAGVKNITGAYETPEFINWGDGISTTDEKGKKELSVNALPVDLDFIKTMQMQLVAGRDFQESDFYLMDTSNKYANFKNSYIINETTAKKLGWTPEQAVGKTIDKGAPGPITGVVKDFHFESLHEPIKPLVIFLGQNFVQNFIVRIDGQNMPSTINRLSQLWKERVAHRPFEYHFLEEDYNKLYQAEQKIMALFIWAAGLAIVLACLGLFGLAAFTTVQRTKEIGIRRVLGAGTVNIAWLLSSGFVRLVIIAILIVVPLAWYAAHQWLQDFAYRININWAVFVLAGIVALLIALVTVSLQAVKAALANPVKSLRAE